MTVTRRSRHAIGAIKTPVRQCSKRPFIMRVWYPSMASSPARKARPGRHAALPSATSSGRPAAFNGSCTCPRPNTRKS
ncbi:hypothetical protein XF14_08495 [Burkholderia gladioli]|nr:hypothetical protein XF14_08495 [Burkholderia gladioli]